MAEAMIWLLALLSFASAQRLGDEDINANGICKSVFCNRMDRLHQLTDCVVILGNLHVLLLEQAHKEDFQNIQFPKLREVTGFVVFYRVNGLESIGQLFPNLAVIRGTQVMYNYALIIYDMPDLKEVGLYSLMRINKGGVIVWAVPQACFVHSINWEVIAPRSRHVLNPSEGALHCNSVCSCTRNAATNHCWNVRKCQRFLSGPDAEKCNEQCFGCRNTNPDDCAICRHRTHRGKCVTKCPEGTLELTSVGYCISKRECKYLEGWAWNHTCVFNCTAGYQKKITPIGTQCVPCDKCEETCGSLLLQTLGNIQDASRCVKINGSLTIHIRSLPDTMEELKTYMDKIEEVTDYVVIYSTPTITSLDFLSSLRRIHGRNLRNGTYSLLVYDMTSLQSLFTDNVTKNLKIDRGTMFFHKNPMLCMKEINKIQQLFPTKPGPIDVPQGSNGYSGGCTKASVSLSVNVLNETTASVNFTHITDPHAHYSILYIRLPQGSRKVFVPETCSDTEWYAYNVPYDIYNNSVVELTSLQPASSYALCVEKYNPEKNILARSGIFNFTTPVGKPEPPFISELVASSSDVIVLRWVDHKIYRPHITRYELDVTLVDIYQKDVIARDHCKNDERRFDEIDIFRHAVVMRPPPEYDRGCESMCGILSSVTAGAMVEEYFDVCSSIEFGCNHVESPRPTNSTENKFVRSLSLDIKGPRNDFQVGGLAPFRDYRFRLRACSGRQCSRSARGVVRTLRSKYADVPTILYAIATENGYISVKWKPPELTNGPVLSYSVHVLPSLSIDEKAQLLPQIWCVSGDKTAVIVNSVEASKYLVRVCSTTLASTNACSDNIKVETATAVSWWGGVIFGFLLFVSSMFVSCFRRRKRDISYELPLLSNMVISESEPPSMMMTDFAELYTIPLRDTHLD